MISPLVIFCANIPEIIMKLINSKISFLFKPAKGELVDFIILFFGFFSLVIALIVLFVAKIMVVRTLQVEKYVNKVQIIHMKHILC